MGNQNKGPTKDKESLPQRPIVNKGPSKDKESLPQRPIVNKAGAGQGQSSNIDHNTSNNSNIAPSASQSTVEPKPVENAKCK